MDNGQGFSGRPLPPLPIILSAKVAGGNVRVLRRGQEVVWWPGLDLGVCQLDRPLGQGQEVKVTAEGTGYFSLLLASKPLIHREAGKKTSKSKQKVDTNNIVKEIKFKMLKSQLRIDVRNNSSGQARVTLHKSGAKTSQFDVALPRDLDPWICFEVQCGNLILTLPKVTDKAKRPRRFHDSYGLNMRRIREREMASLLPNPCAIVVTERPLLRGEVMALGVQPQRKGSQSEVRIFLTPHVPAVLKLHKPEVYFSEEKGLDRFLYEVYRIKKFAGTLKLSLDTGSDYLNVQEVPDGDSDVGTAQRKAKSRTTRSISLSQIGLDVGNPLNVCLEVFRVSVQIHQDSDQEEINDKPSYAGVDETQFELDLPDYLDLTEDEDDYLNPVTVASDNTLQENSSNILQENSFYPPIIFCNPPLAEESDFSSDCAHCSPDILVETRSPAHSTRDTPTPSRSPAHFVQDTFSKIPSPTHCISDKPFPHRSPARIIPDTPSEGGNPAHGLPGTSSSARSPKDKPRTPTSPCRGDHVRERSGSPGTRLGKSGLDSFLKRGEQSDETVASFVPAPHEVPLPPLPPVPRVTTPPSPSAVCWPQKEAQYLAMDGYVSPSFLPQNHAHPTPSHAHLTPDHAYDKLDCTQTPDHVYQKLDSTSQMSDHTLTRPGHIYLTPVVGPEERDVIESSHRPTPSAADPTRPGKSGCYDNKNKKETEDVNVTKNKVGKINGMGDKTKCMIEISPIIQLPRALANPSQY